MTSKQGVSRRRFGEICAAFVVGSIISGAAVHLSKPHEPENHKRKPATVIVESPVTVTVQKTQSSVDEFSDYVAFGDQGKPISELPELLQGEGVRLKGYFTVTQKYGIPLTEDKIRLILNVQKPYGYDPNNIAGLGSLTFEPTGYDSVDGIYGVLSYSVRSGEKRELRNLTFHDIRPLNIYGDGDIVAFIKQSDGEYKLTGRV